MTHAEKTMQEALRRIEKLTKGCKNPALNEIHTLADEALLWAWDDERPSVGED